MNSLFSFLVLLGSFFIIVLFRYFLGAGIAYWLCWKLKRETWSRKRIDFVSLTLSNAQKFQAQIKREIFYSVLTSAIFALAGAIVFVAWKNGHTRVYLDLSRYGWGYLVASFWGVTFIHETYFYWAHRWMHLPKFFKTVHKVHHDSKSPTPWAAFSFHPWEALIEAIILPLLVIFIPLHPVVIVANLVLMSILGVINHTGYELYYRNFARHPIWRQWVSATHHQAHHSKLQLNYGLYYTFWDHWMGTHDRAYEANFRLRHEKIS